MSLAQRLIFPALVGAVVAASVLYWAPEWVMPPAGQTGNVSTLPAPVNAVSSGNPTTTPVSPGEWSGPVSYSRAVQAATPSVVNIYTKKLIRTKVHPLLKDNFFKRFFSNLPQPQRAT